MIEIGTRVRYARHLPSESMVWRDNDDRDIDRSGVVAEISDESCYGHVAYKVLWDERDSEFAAIGRWCAAEQLEEEPAE